MKQEQIKKKIEEVEKQLEVIEINFTNYDYYVILLKIYWELWDLLYFKLYQEKTYLDPPGDKNGKRN